MSFFSGDRERYKLYRYKVLQLSRISEKNCKFLFFFYSSGRLEREKKFIPSGWVTVKKEERGGVEQ